MAKQVIRNKTILEEFIRLALLSEEEERILRTRALGWSRAKQCIEFGMSESTLDRIIKRLKLKYDSVQPYSDILPKRKSKACELYSSK